MTITLTESEYKNLRHALLAAAQIALIEGNKEHANELLDTHEKIIRKRNDRKLFRSTK